MTPRATPIAASNDNRGSTQRSRRSYGDRGGKWRHFERARLRIVSGDRGLGVTL